MDISSLRGASRSWRLGLMIGLMFAFSFGVLPAAYAQDEEFGRQSTELNQLRTIYEQRLSAIEDSHTEYLKGLPGAYSNALTDLKKKLQASGALDALLAVQKEQDRFADFKTVPENALVDGPEILRQLQEQFRMANSRRKANDLILTLRQAYVTRLERLMKDLTIKGALDRAVAVRDEMQRVRATMIRRPEDEAEAPSIPEEVSETPSQSVTAQASDWEDAAESRLGESELNGEQTEVVLKLIPQSRAYELKGVYLVPADCVLHIPGGVTIIADKQSQLLVEGSLHIEGTVEEPVVFKGRVTGHSSWKGILLSSPQEASISGLRVSGAAVGLEVLSPKSEVTVYGCSFLGNRRGFSAGHPTPSRQSYAIEECFFTDNTDYGLVLGHSIAAIEHCTITKNGEGIKCGRAPNVSIDSCIITDNKESGVDAGSATGGGQLTIHNSAIFDNGGDVNIRFGLPSDCDCSSNWWGTATTRILQREGVLTDLKTIHDKHDDPRSGRVILDGFLTKMPADCGVTLDFD